VCESFAWIDRLVYKAAIAEILGDIGQDVDIGKGGVIVGYRESQGIDVTCLIRLWVVSCPYRCLQQAP